MVDNKVFSRMTVNPYTLAKLYNEGIIPYIPYDLCLGTPITQSGLMNSYGSTMNGSQYLASAMKGDMYGYYGNCNDSFTRSASSTNEQKTSTIKTMLGMGDGVGRDYDFKNAALSLNNGYGKGSDLERMANDKDGQDFRQSLTNAVSHTKESVMNSHPLVKGLLATAGVILTVALAVKGLRKKPVTPHVSKWSMSKLNPRNWHLRKKTA